MLKRLSISILFIVASSNGLHADPKEKAVSADNPTTLSQHQDTDISYYGLTQDLKRYSPIEQINPGTIDKLVPVWSLSLGETVGLQTQPLVIEGVMFVTTHDATHAIDALTGRQIWKLKTRRHDSFHRLLMAKAVCLPGGPS
ncbi:MAG: alcohol dehydrogenase (cytochrome c) [Gammaproteobacteria bacterium]|jgi:alcohol dehydrogenase (cytochrome c)